MPQILLATDADWIRDDVVAALEDDQTQVSRVRKGAEVLEAIIQLQPELVILDMQIGNMGGIATCHAIRHEEAADRLDPVKVMILLDRADDRWLADTAQPDALYQKPVDAFALARAVREVLADEPEVETTEDAEADAARDVASGDEAGDGSGDDATDDAAASTALA